MLARRLDDFEADLCHLLELQRKGQRRRAALNAHVAEPVDAKLPGEPEGLDPVSARIWRRRNPNGGEKHVPVPG